jgi:hypothetical protein
MFPAGSGRAREVSNPALTFIPTFCRDSNLRPHMGMNR